MPSPPLAGEKPSRFPFLFFSKSHDLFFSFLLPWQAISDTLSREVVEQIQLRVMDVYSVDDRINAMANYRPDDDY